MSPEEYRAEAYRLGQRFARGRLGAGEAPDTVRVAMDRAQEVLLGLGAYSADLAEMMRLGVEDVLAGRWIAATRRRPDADCSAAPAVTAHHPGGSSLMVTSTAESATASGCWPTGAARSSQCAVEVLDKALPEWDVDRIG